MNSVVNILQAKNCQSSNCFKHNAEYQSQYDLVFQYNGKNLLQLKAKPFWIHLKPNVAENEIFFQHLLGLRAGASPRGGLVDPLLAGPRAPIPGAYAVPSGYLADHQYHLGPAFEDPSGVGMYGFPGTGYAEVGAVGGIPDGAVGYMGPGGRSVSGSLGGGAGAVPHYGQATGGGYGARPREVRTSGYQSVPVDVRRADQAMVSGRVGWTSRATTVGPSRPSESRMQTAPDGRRAGADMAGLAETNLDTSRRTPSVWAGVEPAKLNTGVGYPHLGAGAAGIPQPAYLGQPTPLRQAAPMQLANGQFYQPWVYGPGAGPAPAPYWNYPVESWVRAPQGQLVGIPPSAPVQQGWEAGFTPEARGTQPPVSQPEVLHYIT